MAKPAENTGSDVMDYSSKVANELTGRKKEIWEMATLMTDEENPTDREVARELVHAKTVVDGIDEAMGWITGKKPLPKRDSDWLQKLKEEVERGDFEFDEED